ncbi:MAG: tyrosine recombinase XerC [Jatrophihabitantaceae bacterium]
MTKRNSNGQGSIYKRKDGRWEGAVYLPTVGGMRKRFRCYGRTKQEVQTTLVEQQARAQKGRPLPNRMWRLGEYLDYWLEQVVRTSRSPRTYESYEMTVRLYLGPLLGGQYLTRLTVAQVQVALNQALANGTTVRSAHLMRMVLSAALTRAKREEILDRNVASLAELPIWRRREITPWTAAQVAEFLSSAQDDSLYPAFLLLALYGLRRGEVLGLRWQDIDSDHLRIRQQVQRISGQLQVGPLKTSASRRDLPLLAPARQVLEQHAELQRQQVQSGVRMPNVSDLVFTTRNGQPIEPRNLLRSFERIRRQQGLPHNTLHHLRHTVATLLKGGGVAARDAQGILGHADITTTQQIYQHADAAAQAYGLEQVARLVLPARGSRYCRQSQPSNARLDRSYWRINSGTPGRIRTADPLFRRTTDLSAAVLLPAVHEELRVGYCSHLLGAAAVIFSRQTWTRISRLGRYCLDYDPIPHPGQPGEQGPAIGGDLPPRVHQGPS